MKFQFLFASVLTFILTTGCASEANSPIEPVTRNKGASEKQETHTVELKALKYEGLDPFGRTCVAFVALAEAHEGHAHELLVKIDYNLHGESILDSEGKFYLYDIRGNRYLDKDATEPQARPALLSVKLTDADIEFDPNRMVEYEQQGLLEQSVRLDFLEMNIEEFEETLELVVADDSKFGENSDVLNQLNRAIVKISHNGHYDSVACGDFVASGLETVTFDLEEEHDHDHP